MRISHGKAMARSAAAGMMAALGCGGAAPTTEAPPVPEYAPPLKPYRAGTGEPAARPAAKIAAPAEPSHRSCCKATNDCKGKGNCKVEGRNSCKGQNACKGQGGCKSSDCF